MEYERENPSASLSNAPNERTAPAAVAPREAKPIRSGTKIDGKTYYSDISHNPELTPYFD